MEFEQGIDYERVNYLHPGSSLPESGVKDDTDPVWELRRNLLETPLSSMSEISSLTGVVGAFVVSGVLRGSECDQLRQLVEHLGFTPGRATVGMSPELRDNEVCVFMAPTPLVAELSTRLAPFVPRWGAGGDTRCNPDFINPRFRCYRYLSSGGALDAQAPQHFGPHYDGAQYATKFVNKWYVEDFSAARKSQMSVLLYLSEGHDGGETVFYPDGHVADLESAVRVTPSLGNALCFWHGDHLLSSLHEGAAIKGGSSPKYVIRTDIFFDKDD